MSKVTVLLFILAIVPRLLYLASIPREAILESVDARGYDLLARNLVAGHGFSREDAPPYQPDGLRTPLYPGLVAAVYAITGSTSGGRPAGPLVVATAQALLDGLTVLIVGALAGTLLGPRAGVGAAILYALTPVQWRYSAALLPEVPLAFLVALTIWLLVRYLHRQQQSTDSSLFLLHTTLPAVTYGALAGLAALLKPNLSGLALIVAAATGWALCSGSRQGQRFSRSPRSRFSSGLLGAGTVVLTASIVVAPWIVRNWTVFGRPFLSNAGLGFVARVFAPATLGIVQDSQVPPWSPEWEGRYHAIVTQTAARYGWSERSDIPSSPAESDRRERQIAQTAWQIVLRHPGAAVRAYLVGFVRSWAPLEQTFWYTHLSGQRWEETGIAANGFRDAIEILLDWRPLEAFELSLVQPWAKLDPLGRVLWYGWGLGCLLSIGLSILGLLSLRREPIAASVLGITILYATLPPGPIGYARFRVAVMPLITILIVSGIAALYSVRPLSLPAVRGILSRSKPRGKDESKPS